MVEFRINMHFSAFFPWLQSAKSFHFFEEQKYVFYLNQQRINMSLDLLYLKFQMWVIELSIYFKICIFV